jgi:hypothetical protein
MTDTTAAFELNDLLDISDNRFGIGAGYRFRVLGIAPQAEEGRVTTIQFTVWR